MIDLAGWILAANLLAAQGWLYDFSTGYFWHPAATEDHRMVIVCCPAPPRR